MSEATTASRGLLASFGWYIGICLVVLVIPAMSLLYISRIHMAHPVTGIWTGTLQAEDGSAYRRAVYVKTSIDPLRWKRPTLFGAVEMCDSKDEIDYSFETFTMSSDTSGLTLFAKDGSESGRLFSTLQDGKMQASYDGMEPELSGSLQRGSIEDFHHACAALRGIQ